MENAPVVVSPGQRCARGSSSFVSFAGKLPFVCLPNREAIVLNVKRQAPVLERVCRRYVVDDPEFERLIGRFH
eukprot:826953-Lingulodinium_polyedra.AAC.1